MPRPLSHDVKSKIISDYLKGFSRDENAERNKVGGGTVTRVIDEFMDKVNRDGVVRAAEVYGVSEIVSNLREIGEVLNSNDIPISEGVEGANIAALLKKINIKPRDLEGFLNSTYDICKKNNFTVDEIVEYGRALDDLQSRYGKSYGELKNEYESMVDSIPQLKTQYSELSKKVNDAKAEYNKLLKDNRVTEEELKNFISLRSALEGEGLSLNDLESIKDLLKHLEDEGFNTKHIVEKLKAIEDLEDKLREVKREYDDVKREFNSISKELEEKRDMLNEINALKSLGIDLKMLQEIRRIVINIATARGYSNKEALDKFYNDINEKYDTTFGLDQEISMLNKQLEKKQNELSELDLLYKDSKKAIGEYKNLRSKGITDEQIISWNNLLSRCRLDPMIFEAELERYADYKEMVNTLEKDIKTLEKRKEELENEKNAILSSINELKETAINDIKDISSKALNDLSAISNELKNNIDSFNERVGETRDNIDELVKRAIELGRNIEKEEIFKPLITLINEKNGRKEAIIPLMLRLLDALDEWAKKNNYYNVELATRELRNSLGVRIGF